MSWKLLIPMAAVLALAAGCGSRKCSSRPPGFYVAISGSTFHPASLAVPPGATVTVINEDSIGHSVTSEAAPNGFVPGAVAGVSFDTGVFVGDRSFTVGAAAPEGTVVPFFCSVHKAMMSPANGSIVVHASAVAGPPPAAACMGGGGGGY